MNLPVELNVTSLTLPLPWLSIKKGTVIWLFISLFANKVRSLSHCTQLVVNIKVVYNLWSFTVNTNSFSPFWFKSSFYYNKFLHIIISSIDNYEVNGNFLLYNKNSIFSYHKTYIVYVRPKCKIIVKRHFVTISLRNQYYHY